MAGCFNVSYSWYHICIHYSCLSAPGLYVSITVNGPQASPTHLQVWVLATRVPHRASVEDDAPWLDEPRADRIFCFSEASFASAVGEEAEE